MSIDLRFRIERDSFVLDVELAISSTGVTAVLGPSGSGKTTLLRALAGLECPSEGYLKVDNEIWQDGQRFLPVHRRSLGYVFQEASLFSHLSVRRNLEYGLKRTRRTLGSSSFSQVVALLGLENLLDRRPEGLSGGERQRAAIARALLTSPRLLLMDEPLSSLDLESKKEILPFLERLPGELSIPMLYVSHSPDEVARLSDHIVLLEKGRVRGSGAIGEVFTRMDLPLARGQEAEAIISAVVAEHDQVYGLTYLDFVGGRFTITQKSLPLGKKVRLRVLAKDVSLTLKRQTGTSILNIFPARVEELSDQGPAQVVVRLTLAGTPVLARITRKSAAALDLEVGKMVFVQVKTAALLG